MFRGADKGKKGKVGQLEWREGLTSLSASLTLPTFNTIRLWLNSRQKRLISPIIRVPTKYGHSQLKVDVEYKNTHFRSLEGPVMLLWVILEYKPSV